MRFKYDLAARTLRPQPGDATGCVLWPKSPERALTASIQKWRHLANMRELTGLTVDGGTDTCALCQLFYHRDCKGCPVMWKTGLPACDGSPYMRFVKARNAPEKRQAAKKELTFLVTLRQEWEQKRLTLRRELRDASQKINESATSATGTETALCADITES